MSVVAASLLLLGLASTQAAAVGDAGVFYGLGGCLAVAENQSLSEGARLIVLAADRRPTQVRVETVRQPVEVSECADRFRDEQPSRLARVVLPDPLQDDVIFAVGARPNLVVLGGPPVKLSAREAERWTRVVSASLPTPWRSKNVLVHAFRYGPASGQAAVELYLGRPTLNPPGLSPPIHAIAIRRFFLVAGKVLASEEYERASGREERAESEPPELTFDNWSASDTEQTVAFMSEDKGRSWKRLSTDVGFEGIWWIAQALRSGLPRTFEQFLYTTH